ncbi:MULTISPECIES: hypothetical protein [Bradyrhizobium]
MNNASGRLDVEGTRPGPGQAIAGPIELMSSRHRAAPFGVDENDMDIQLIAPETTQPTGKISNIRGKPRTFGPDVLAVRPEMAVIFVSAH